MTRVFAFASLVAIVLACANKPGDAIQLRFNMAKGDKFEYATTLEMNMQQATLQQQEGTMKNSMAFTYLFEVLNDSADVKTIASTISHIRMDMSAMGNSMQVDSDQPEKDTVGPMGMIGKIFGVLKGARFTFKMDNKGTISDFQGLGELQQRIAAQFPGSAPIGLDKMFNEETFRQNMQQTFAAYPGKPVKPGDTWTKLMTMQSQGMNVKAENTYTLDSIKGNVAVVRLNSKLSSAGASTEMKGMEINMTGTSAGSVHYDIKTGMPVDGNIESKMSVQMKTQGVDVPMNMNTSMKVKGKKL